MESFKQDLSETHASTPQDSDMGRTRTCQNVCLEQQHFAICYICSSKFIAPAIHKLRSALARKKVQIGYYTDHHQLKIPLSGGNFHVLQKLPSQNQEAHGTDSVEHRIVGGETFLGKEIQLVFPTKLLKEKWQCHLHVLAFLLSMQRHSDIPQPIHFHRL